MAPKETDQPLGDQAARRQALRLAEKAAREASALRANLQRRKAQARERAVPAAGAVDAPAPDPQKKDSITG